MVVPGIFAEHLLNNRLKMGLASAIEKLVTLTKQIKIGLCEQVRVNLANRRACQSADGSLALIRTPTVRVKTESFPAIVPAKP